MVHCIPLESVVFTRRQYILYQAIENTVATHRKHNQPIQHTMGRLSEILRVM